MKRQHMNYLGMLAVILGVVVGCHQPRRPVSVRAKTPKLKVVLLGMSDIGEAGLEYHLTGCTKAEGTLEMQFETVVFSSRALKKGLGGCIVTVTSNDSTGAYEFTRAPGILWMSGEFGVSKEENGMLMSEARMEKTYNKRDGLVKRVDPSGPASTLDVELSSCSATEYFDDSSNSCQACPGGTEYRQAVGACVVPSL